MSLFGNLFNRSRESREREAVYKMVTDRGNGFYAWNGNLYQSDIVRACIRPQTKAVGKLIAKHIVTSIGKDGKSISVNPKPYIRFLLEEPNELMSGQMLLEKVANQLALNNNAFVLIIRNEHDLPIGLYPIPATGVEAVYKNEELYLKFYYHNGKQSLFPYKDIIHIRDDFNENDIFGTAPGAALAQLMNNVTTIDQGLVNAIKNSQVIKWLLKFTSAMRKEDQIIAASEFSKNFMSIDSDTNGVAVVDAKADAIQVKSDNYVPNAAIVDRNTQRIYNFFNTNQHIVDSTYTEEEWVSYYEARIEPVALQLKNEFTRKMFTRHERAYGNEIVFEASSLEFASIKTKLALISFVDRGIMTPNEVRKVFNMAPVEGGDTVLLRKDTGILTEGGTAE